MAFANYLQYSNILALLELSYRIRNQWGSMALNNIVNSLT
jgi:hypothetical protein